MTPPTILSTNSYSPSGVGAIDDVAVAELAAAARLLLVAAVGARLAADRLAVRDARRMQLDVDAEAPLRALERDLDVHLAHPGEDLLPGLLVAAETQRRILLREAANRRRDLLLVALRLRRDREAHDRLGEPEVRHLDRDLLVGEQVARLRVLQLRDGAEVALAEVERGMVLLPLHLEERAHALLPLRAEVHERRVGGDRALEDAEEVDAARRTGRRRS